jgi:hypothetical protein
VLRHVSLIGMMKWIVFVSDAGPEALHCKEMQLLIFFREISVCELELCVAVT